MKIVFCDIDGVLNNRDHLILSQSRENGEPSKVELEGDSAMISSVLVGRLNSLCRQTDAKVVISSTWRRIHPLGRLQKFLKNKGLDADVIDSTPTGDKDKFCYRTRGHEIQAWLKEQNDVDSFVIFDDCEPMGPVAERCVYTSFHDGLTIKDCNAAEQILNTVIEKGMLKDE